MKDMLLMIAAGLLATVMIAIGLIFAALPYATAILITVLIVRGCA